MVRGKSARGGKVKVVVFCSKWEVMFMVGAGYKCGGCRRQYSLLRYNVPTFFMTNLLKISKNYVINEES